MAKRATLVLEDDENYVNFGKLLAKAWAEGRIDGQYRCGTCGMRYRHEAEVINCCTAIIAHPHSANGARDRQESPKAHKGKTATKYTVVTRRSLNRSTKWGAP